MFKYNIHLFRGVSIIFIVFSHCYNISITSFDQNNDLLAKVYRNMVSGGSAFFVFISGFLFLTIYKSNNNYFSFIWKKIKFVYIPFLFFISFDIFYLFFKLFINNHPLSNKLQFYKNALFNFDFYTSFFLGKSFVTYNILWYIPFIMMMYLISPFFLYYSKLRLKSQIHIFLFSLIVSLFLHRNYSFDFVKNFQNVIYFMPFYLLGILSSINEEKKFFKISNNILFILVIFSIVIPIIKNLFQMNIFKLIDVMMFQKLFFCIFFSALLQNTNSRNLKIINLLANNSFGIFFVHPFLLLLLGKATNILEISFKTESFFLYFFIAFSILFTSLIIVIIIKKIFGSRSKYFIGL